MQKPIANALLTLAIVVLVGCSNPADNVAEAEVQDAPAVTSPDPSTPSESDAGTDAPAPVTAAKPFVISGDSKIEFLASKAIGGETPGGFGKFIGQLNVADGKLVGGSKIVIDVESIWTKSNKLTAHLKNQDFFNVEKIPTATFELTKIEALAEGKQKVTGTLTMHDVSKSIAFPATVTVAEDSVSLKAEFFINRFDFDMKYPGQIDNLIREEVVIKLDITAAPGEADFTAL